MKRFIIEDDFWQMFPEARIGVVIARGIDNTTSSPAIGQLLKEAHQAALRHLNEPVLSNNPAVAVWRRAFQQFKTKKGARSSIEALLKRVQKGQTIGQINPLVDLYNAVSLRHGFPCGGEDIAAFAGDLRLTLARGDEPFITLGSEESAPPLPGELIYKDDAGAVCRCWNWRESVRTMLTPDTTQAFLAIESVDPERADEHQAALAELSELIQKHLGGQVETALLSRERPEIKLTD